MPVTCTKPQKMHMKNVYFIGVWYACYMKLYLDDTIKFTMNEQSINLFADSDECA